MSDQEIHVTGLSDLQFFLDRLAPTVRRNVLRGALRAGMTVVRDAAKPNIHSVSGELAKGLKVSTRFRGTDGAIATVKTKGEHGFLGTIVEYGTAAHFIRSERGMLRLADGRILTEVLHPGARPKPFLRPALDSQAEAAVIAMAEYIKERLVTREGFEDASKIDVGGDT